jgi:glycosyltransferase involved in cell wall biosynthesis
LLCEQLHVEQVPRGSKLRANTWIVLPAYNAESTLENTVEEIPREFHGRIILVDDNSTDNTVAKAEELGLHVIRHEVNKGYGGNQKTCYKAAIKHGAEIVIMLHPDHQYDPRVLGVMSDLIELGNCDIVLGNRIRTRYEALSGGMPKWRYFINRTSTFVENILLGQTIGDFHSGLRGYSRKVLENIPFEENSDGFSFDQEFLVEAVSLKFRIADIPIPVKYEINSSSISPRNTIRYGIGAVAILAKYFLHKTKILRDIRFKSKLTNE